MYGALCMATKAFYSSKVSRVTQGVDITGISRQMGYVELAHVSDMLLWKITQVCMRFKLQMQVVIWYCTCTCMAVDSMSTEFKLLTGSGLKQDTKYFQNVMLVGMARKSAKSIAYRCVVCSRHSGFEALCYEQSIHLCVYFLLISVANPTDITFGIVFVSYSFTYWVLY